MGIIQGAGATPLGQTAFPSEIIQKRAVKFPGIELLDGGFGLSQVLRAIRMKSIEPSKNSPAGLPPTRRSASFASEISELGPGARTSRLPSTYKVRVDALRSLSASR